MSKDDGVKYSFFKDRLIVAVAYVVAISGAWISIQFLSRSRIMGKDSNWGFCWYSDHLLLQPFAEEFKYVRSLLECSANHYTTLYNVHSGI